MNYKFDTTDIELVAHIGLGFTYENARLRPEDVPTFFADPAAWYAKEHGVAKDVYLDWLANTGCTRCSAKTKSGKPCRNLAVPGGMMLPLEAWVKHDGGYCRVHGGDKDA